LGHVAGVDNTVVVDVGYGEVGGGLVGFGHGGKDTVDVIGVYLAVLNAGDRKISWFERVGSEVDVVIGRYIDISKDMLEMFFAFDGDGIWAWRGAKINGGLVNTAGGVEESNSGNGVRLVVVIAPRDFGFDGANVFFDAAELNAESDGVGGGSGRGRRRGGRRGSSGERSRRGGSSGGRIGGGLIAGGGGGLCREGVGGGRSGNCG